MLEWIGHPKQPRPTYEEHFRKYSKNEYHRPDETIFHAAERQAVAPPSEHSSSGIGSWGTSVSSYTGGKVHDGQFHIDSGLEAWESVMDGNMKYAGYDSASKCPLPGPGGWYSPDRARTPKPKPPPHNGPADDKPESFLSYQSLPASKLQAMAAMNKDVAKRNKAVIMNHESKKFLLRKIAPANIRTSQQSALGNYQQKVYRRNHDDARFKGKTKPGIDEELQKLKQTGGMFDSTTEYMSTTKVGFPRHHVKKGTVMGGSDAQGMARTLPWQLEKQQRHHRHDRSSEPAQHTDGPRRSASVELGAAQAGGSAAAPAHSLRNDSRPSGRSHDAKASKPESNRAQSQRRAERAVEKALQTLQLKRAKSVDRDLTRETWDDWRPRNK